MDPWYSSISCNALGVFPKIAGRSPYAAPAARIGLLDAPAAWFTGVPVNEWGAVGDLLGKRTVLNACVGHPALEDVRETLSPRAFTLATNALAGLADPASVGMLVGALAQHCAGAHE